MEKDWEELSHILASEIKREIAENYFSEKLYLEDEWENYYILLEELKKELKKIFNNAWRIYFILNGNPDLIEKFEKISNFPLTDIIKDSQILYPKFYQISQQELKEKLLSRLISPFGFTSKGKFVKLLYNVYKSLFKVINNYLKLYKNMEEYYGILNKETESFHKKFDLSYILSFFKKFENQKEEEMGEIIDKQKVIEELTETLKIKVPDPLEKTFKKYNSIREPSQIYSEISALAQISFKHNPENAKNLLKYLK